MKYILVQVFYYCRGELCKACRAKRGEEENAGNEERRSKHGLNSMVIKRFKVFQGLLESGSDSGAEVDCNHLLEDDQAGLTKGLVFKDKDKKEHTKRQTSQQRMDDRKERKKVLRQSSSSLRVAVCDQEPQQQLQNQQTSTFAVWRAFIKSFRLSLLTMMSYILLIGPSLGEAFCVMPSCKSIRKTLH